MTGKLKILILEDVAEDAEVVKRLLKKEGLKFDFEIALDKPSYLLALQQYKPDVILADHTLPQFNSVEALELMQQQLPCTVFILVTGTVSEEFAAAVIKKGADDYILKDRMTRLPAAIDLAVKHKWDEKEKNKSLQLLTESEKKYRILFERNLAGVYRTTPAGKIITCNDAFAHLLGYDSKEEILQIEAWHLYFPNEYRDAFINTLRIKKEISNGEAVMKHRNGSPVYFLENCTFHTDKVTGEEFIEGVMVDITDRKNAEEETLKAKQRIEMLMTASAVMLYSCEAFGDFDARFISENITGITGYTTEDFLSKGFWASHIHPEDAPGVFEGLSNLLKQNVYSHEYRFMFKDGTYHFMSDQLKLIKDKKGNPQDILGTWTDISERKKAEKEIKESEERFSSIFKAAPGSIILFSLSDGKIVEVNDNFSNITGYSRKEAIGKNTGELGMWADPADREKYLALLEKKGIVTNFEADLKHKSGKILNALVSGYIITIQEKKYLLGVFYDITEQKKADENLRKFIERFEMIARTTNDALWEWNLETGELWANQMHQHLYGLTTADPVPAEGQWEQRLHPADRERIIAAQQQALASDKTGWISEYRFETNDKGYIDIYDRCYIVRNDAGNPIRLTGTMMDITERKKAESALSENEKYLRTILDTEPECVKVLNRKGELLSMNPAGLAMIEADNEQQVIGHRITELVDEKFRMGFNRLIKNVFNGSPGTFEFEVTGLKGGHRWLETHAVPLQDAAGKTTNLLGVTRDITERKKAEEEIQKLATIVQRSPEFIGIAALDAKVIYLNDGGKNMVGLDLDITTTSMWDYFAPPDLEIFQNKAIPAIQKEGRWVGDINLKNFQTGELIPVWMDIFYIFHQQTKVPIAFATITSDITERKKAEEEIKNSNIQLRQLTAHLQTIREKERKRIAREIHDELGQQLTAIKMDTVWIDKKTPEESTVVKSKLKNIITLLDGSNQSVRKILSELRPGNLENQALTETMEWQGRQFTESTGIPVKFTSPETNLRLNEETATCIFRLYQESLTNIMRYAEAKKVSVSLIPKDDSIILTVEDDGKGFDIAAAQNKKTFGLLGMKERVFSLNGKFELLSAKGKGTKIVISLPYKYT